MMLSRVPLPVTSCCEKRKKSETARKSWKGSETTQVEALIADPAQALLLPFDAKRDSPESLPPSHAICHLLSMDFQRSVILL
jgi:hypothetical protein